MLRIFDSKTNQLINIDDPEISIYNCGPTVYNHIHIGNARPLITFDVLIRLLIYQKKNYKYVLNITDIDDKIINESNKQNIDELELSELYTQQYFKIKRDLNTIEMINPKVSENIDGIIDYIDMLVDKKAAYIIDGNVYFNISLIDEYGSISKKNVEKLLTGARVEMDQNKINPNDFVLWKKTNNGIKWNTKWSLGRPGWHTECSYLIHKLIGNQVTIHGGGMDLKFPHHENENAQNIALFGVSLAKVWMHIGIVNIDNKKMSKSLNNFVLVKDILKKYSYQSIRWFFYQSGYANPLNYSNEIMDNMEKEIAKLRLSINQAKTYLILNNVDYQINNNQINKNFIAYLEDNLNLNNAISIVYEINKKLNIAIRNKDSQNVHDLYFDLINCLNILGIEFKNIHNPQNIDLIHLWNQCINKKDYQKADELRNELINKGLI